MKDTIRISGISGRGKHGVYDFERKSGQKFVVDVSMKLDLRPAGKTDALVDTIDYGEVAKIVHAHVVGDPVKLIESLAQTIAADILAMGPIHKVKVTVRKPNAPIDLPFDDVSVTVNRKASS